MIEKKPNKEQSSIIKSAEFLRHFPNAFILQIENKELPKALQERIKKTNDNTAFLIRFYDGTKTFGTTGGFGGKIQLLDLGIDDQILGEGNIEPDHIEDLGIPIDGFTFTKEKFRNKGLGTRRLLIMNALSWMFFNKPLHSSPYQERPQNRRIWEDFVAKGKAEQFKGERLIRYRFLI